MDRMDDIHPLIQRALAKEIEYFRSEDHEWQLKLEEDAAVQKLVDEPILIFANNGYGDFLFLKFLVVLFRRLPFVCPFG